jgi:hypothetical protein
VIPLLPVASDAVTYSYTSKTASVSAIREVILGFNLALLVAKFLIIISDIKLTFKFNGIRCFYLLPPLYLMLFKNPALFSHF